MGRGKEGDTSDMIVRLDSGLPLEGIAIKAGGKVYKAREYGSCKRCEIPKHICGGVVNDGRGRRPEMWSMCIAILGGEPSWEEAR